MTISYGNASVLSEKTHILNHLLMILIMKYGWYLAKKLNIQLLLAFR